MKRHGKEGREKGLEKKKGIGSEEKDRKRMGEKVWNKNWRKGRQ